VGYCTEFLPLLALLSKSAGPGASAVTFFKIFLSFALFVCMAVAILYFFGKLVIELFGILDGRSPRSSDRYARN
jgi:Kef-type K+ transport system membrane component KefB